MQCLEAQAAAASAGCARCALVTLAMGSLSCPLLGNRVLNSWPHSRRLCTPKEPATPRPSLRKCFSNRLCSFTLPPPFQQTDVLPYLKRCVSNKGGEEFQRSPGLYYMSVSSLGPRDGSYCSVARSEFRTLFSLSCMWYRALYLRYVNSKLKTPSRIVNRVRTFRGKHWGLLVCCVSEVSAVSSSG